MVVDVRFVGGSLDQQSKRIDAGSPPEWAHSFYTLTADWTGDRYELVVPRERFAERVEMVVEGQPPPTQKGIIH